MLHIFSVFDSAAGAFLDPFHAQTTEVAMRMMREICNRPDHQFSKYPEDYTLFEIGSFDPQTGVLEPLATPHPLGLALSFKDNHTAAAAPAARHFNGEPPTPLLVADTDAATLTSESN